MQATIPTRRTILRHGALAAAAAAIAQLPSRAFGATESAGDVVLPFLDPQTFRPGKAALHWDELKDWITPTDQVYDVSHYGTPKSVPAAGDYKLEIAGLVDKPRSLSLDDIKRLPRKEITATLECSGNGAGKDFCGAIGNAEWAGTPLAPLLKECGVAPEAIEAAFWGFDHKAEKVRGADYDMNFARALGMADAMRDDVILAYEMNGQPLTLAHGAPLRLVVPGWYGITWVKWLSRIELRDRRLMNRFMARDYVTIRGSEDADGHVTWTETSVGPMNLKSLVAKVTKHADGSATVMGAAWSGMTPVKAVEVRVDDGDWVAATLDESHTGPHTWRFWTYTWKNPTPGEHTLTSRAVDAKANIQPAPDDPAIKLKKTYWEANQQWPRKVKV